MKDEWIKDTRIINGCEKDFYFKFVNIDPIWNDDGQQMITKVIIWKDNIVPPHPKNEELISVILFYVIVSIVFVMVSLVLGFLCDRIR